MRERFFFWGCRFDGDGCGVVVVFVVVRGVFGGLFELTVYVGVCAAKPLRDQVARPTIRAWWDLDWIGTSWHVVIFAKWTVRPWSEFLSRW